MVTILEIPKFSPQLQHACGEGVLEVLCTMIESQSIREK